MIFIAAWILNYILILACMTLDNFCWVRSSPEWSKVKSYSTREYISYLFFKRVAPVWTDFRDIIPAIISSLALTLVKSYWFSGMSVLIIAFILAAFIIKLTREET